MLRAALKPCVLLTLCSLCLMGKSAIAGPPYITDDPEPVEYKHMEVYVATLYNNDKAGLSGTAPHLEVNYGVVPNVQLHIIAPMSYNRPAFGSMQYGYGTTELGVKWRFVQEKANTPMVGIFPLVELPTGDAARGLGTGDTAIYLPVWAQKSWGTWTMYGGGGYWHNPGAGNKDYGYIGWLIQKNVTKKLSIGTELFYTTATVAGGTTQTGFNIGAVYDFDEGHHLMFSVGDDLHGSNRGMGYLAYQWTMGPHEPEKKEEAPVPQKVAAPTK